MKTRNRTRKGFTLVELLVVISIIGMLMAMLLPAVQAARESARANTCRNNLKNLALAAVTYETQKNIFPGFQNDILPTAPSTSDNHQRSWMFVLLPYLDHRSVFDQYKDKDPVTLLADPDGTLNSEIANTIELFNCPSNPPEATGVANTSYCANVGQVDKTAAPTAALPTRDYAGNGVFHYRGVKANTNEILVSMNIAYIAGSDGVGTTIMLSENADAYQWPSVTERYAGFGYYEADATPGANPAAGDPMGINVQYGQSKTGGGAPNVDNGYMRPSAYHPSGVNFAFCDGRVKFISEDVSYGVYQALMTPRGSKAIDNATDTAFPVTHGAARIVDEASFSN